MDKLLRISLHCKLRLVEDDESAKIFYSITKLDKERGTDEQNYIVIDNSQIPAVQKLLSVTYPDYIELLYLPASQENDNIKLVGDLWEKWLVDLKEPIVDLSIEDDSEDDMN